MVNESVPANGLESTAYFFFHWLFDFIAQFIIVLDRGMHLLLDHSAICIMLAIVADYASLFFSVLDNCQEILCWVFSLFFY